MSTTSIFSNVLKATFLRLDIAKATITRIDASAAESMEVAVGVFRGEKMNSHHEQAWHTMLGRDLVSPPPLAPGVVKHRP
jgi:hypothetical protein